MAKNRQMYNHIVNEVCVTAVPLRISLYRHKCKYFRRTAWYSTPPSTLFVFNLSIFCSVEMVNTKMVFVATPRTGSVWLLGIIIYQNHISSIKKSMSAWLNWIEFVFFADSRWSLLCPKLFEEPLMSDHTFASVSRTNGSAEGMLHVRISLGFAWDASLWVWRSVCRLSDSICPLV